MRGLQAAARVFLLAWHVSLAASRLGIRLLACKLTRRPRAHSSAVGRTLVELLVSLGPTYVKLGQLLSTRRDLFSESTCRELERLQDGLPPVPFGVVRALFRRELGVKLGDVFSEIDRTAVASASVASVYRGRLRDGRLVAVKVLRPGIGTRIKADLALLQAATRLLGWLPPLRHVPLRLAVDEFGACLVRQLDFKLEAASNRRLRSALSSHSHVLMPALVEELCSSSILTMDFVDGLPKPRPVHGDVARMALLEACRALYRMIFVEGFVHCDLHQGNLHFLADGRAALVDFGFMTELECDERLAFAAFFYSIATNDGARCAQIVIDTALYVPPDLKYEKFEADVIALIQSVSRARANEFQVAKFIVQLFDLQRHYRIMGTTAYTMVLLSLLIFEGIAKESYPDLDFQREALPFIFRASIRGNASESWSTPATTSSLHQSEPSTAPSTAAVV